jgi:Tol biopolymer transport system component
MPLVLNRAAFLPLLFLCAASARLYAQPEAYSHPELKWKTIETAHFTVNFHEGAERSARVAAKIAEEIYAPITSLYHHEPGKVNIIIKDTDDYSNGGAYFFENKIEIWAPALEFGLRGQHNWLRNVITHEFTHIVTLTAAMKFGTGVPAVYLQGFGYEPVRRPDILYGFPNVLVSYPVAGVNLPFWLAEGVAQYQRPELGYDTWDSHRDMILRSLALDKKIFSLDELSNYASKKGIEFEFTYNSGYALTRFLAERYGEEKLEQLCKNFASLAQLNVHHALEATYQKSSDDIYREWRTYVERDYQSRISNVLANRVEGKLIETRGYANAYPAFSPDGKKLYYISNLGADFGGHVVLERDLQGDSLKPEASGYRPTVSDLFALGKAQEGGNQCRVCGFHFGASHQGVLLAGATSRITVSPDGKKLYYSKYVGTTFQIQKYNDLFVFDLDSKQETRLTTQLRLETPALSPDAKHFVAVEQKDGTQNVVEGVLDSAQTSLRRLTNFSNGEQVHLPSYSPDGKSIVFSLGVNGRRKLMIYHRGQDAVWTMFPVVYGDSLLDRDDLDERDASYSPDGKYLYFASNRTGIFNIYRANLETHLVEQLTNVVGGAFMPSSSPSGDLAFANFTSDGYKISLLKNAQPLQHPNATYVRRPVSPKTSSLTLSSPELASLNAGATIDSSKALSPTLLSLATFDDSTYPTFPEREYSQTFSGFQVLPILRFDAYAKSQGSFLKDTWRATKLGVAFGSSELLGRLGFFGSVALAPGSGQSGGAGGLASILDLERDAFLSFEYTDQNFLPASMLPKFTLDVFHQTRNVTDGARINVGLDSASANVFYTLTQFDLSFRFRMPIEFWLFQASMFRLTFSLSPYASKIGSFFWEPINQLVPASSDTYFIGRTVSFVWNMDLRARTIHTAINPVGFFSRIRLDYENSSLQRDLKFDQGSSTFRPVYENFSFARLITDLNFHLPLPTWSSRFRHTLTVRSYSAFNFTPKETDLFFNNFISGLLGMRGYEYFAIGGDQATFLHLEYRFPIAENINVQFMQFYFDKLYLSTFFDVGAAWNQWRVPAFSEWRRDIGVELRLEAPSFYLFPTRVFFSATYGLDEFSQPLRSQFFTPDGRNFVTYGREWRFHFGVLFDFNFLADGARNAFAGILR